MCCFISWKPLQCKLKVTVQIYCQIYHDSVFLVLIPVQRMIFAGGVAPPPVQLWPIQSPAVFALLPVCSLFWSGNGLIESFSCALLWRFVYLFVCLFADFRPCVLVQYFTDFLPSCALLDSQSDTKPQFSALQQAVPHLQRPAQLKPSFGNHISNSDCLR